MVQAIEVANAPMAARRKFALPGDRAILFLGVFVVAAALAPAAIVRIPAMVDYLNQIARVDILARAGGPDASPFYDVEWNFYPNLAVDLLVPPVARLIGAVDALRLFLLLSQMLIVSGAAALEFAVKGRIRLSPFIACLFLYSLPFSFGFLNFEFGLGAALWALAAMIAVKDRAPMLRLAIHSALCVVLFASHLFAFGVYGAALGLYELSQLRSPRTDWTRVCFRLALLAPPAAFLFAALVLSVGTIGSEGNFWFFSSKARIFFGIFNAYNYEISALCAALSIAGAVFLAKKGALFLSRPGAFIAVGFAVLYLVLPSRLFGTSYADLRVLPGAALILPAFMTLRLPEKNWRLALAGAASAAALVNIALVLSVWLGAAPDYREMIASFGRLPQHSRIIIGHSEEGRDPPADLTQYPFYHAPALAVVYADAFTPTLFTSPGSQPIRPKPFIRPLDVPYAGPVPAALLEAAAAGRAPGWAPEFVRRWPRDFDYLYVLGPAKPNPLPGVLDAIARGRKFALYRIRKPPEATASPADQG